MGKVINRNFYIPDGLVGFSHDNDADEFERDVVNDNEYESSELYESVEISDYSDEDSELDDEVNDALPVPEIYGVVSQTFRTLPDGTQVVDVVIEVEDFDGVEYERAVTQV